MDETARAARNDLAFLKAVTEDRGPLPSIFGAGLMAAGLIYGANLMWIWLGLTGRAPWNEAWMPFSWVPGTLIYVPVQVYLSWKSRGVSFGPSARVFSAAWTAMGMMTLAIVAVVAVASYTAQANYAVLWPPVALALYGGAWSVVAMIRRSGPTFAVAAGCFATSVLCAALVKSTSLWLAMGLALLAFFAIPGWLILRQAPRD